MQSSPVLCREEALVYLENYLRGSRNAPDLAELARYLELLPEDEHRDFPVDVPTLLTGLRTELARAQ